MSKIYVGDEGTLFRLDTKADLTDASVTKMFIQKPGGDEVEWDGAPDVDINTKVAHTIAADELDLAGEWVANSYVVNLSGKWTGDSVKFTVHNRHR